VGQQLVRPWRVTAVSVILALVLTILLVLLSGNQQVLNLGIAIALLCSLPTSYAISRLITYYHHIVEQQNEELIALNEELIRTNSDLEAFAYMVAHDLKTPLTNMVGFSNLLCRELMDGDTENVLEFAAKIEQTGLLMGNIVNELLLLAQVRNRDSQLMPLNMQQVVTRAEQRLSVLIEEHQGEIIHPAQWPVCLGYAPWIEEVWVNYMSNAIKYGGIPPVLELGATYLGNDMVKFWVKDNGRGLTEAERSRLFTEFTRLDQTRAQGHGLGLSIVRRIVEKSGGVVGVDCPSGEGCLFYFTLAGETRVPQYQTTEVSRSSPYGGGT
jgi:signal transduction histidine kinase